jgi:shikimate dehydrogenase
MKKKPNYKAELVGLFGHPVSENTSSVIHEAGFKKLGLNWRYLIIEVFPNDLEKAVIGLKAFNMRGVNVTMPYKIEIMQYLDEITAAAILIGAVNTVYRKKDKLIGENTDGKGFLLSLKEYAKINPKGKNVVILGAGGAARAISVELALSGIKNVIVVNRTPERGKKLVELLNDKINVEASFISWNKPFIIPPQTDILVNATSIGLYPNTDKKPNILYDSIKKEMVVCDVIPTPPDTLFLTESRKKGAKTIDGMGMLLNQAAIAFKIWTGMDAPLDYMKRALKKELELIE